MAIRVSKGYIRTFGKTYSIGETIKGLPEEEEARLVSEGYAEYVIKEAPMEDGQGTGKDAIFLEDGQDHEEDTMSPEDDEPQENINIQFDAEKYIDQEPSTKKGRK